MAITPPGSYGLYTGTIGNTTFCNGIPQAPRRPTPRSLLGSAQPMNGVEVYSNPGSTPMDVD